LGLRGKVFKPFGGTNLFKVLQDKVHAMLLHLVPLVPGRDKRREREREREKCTRERESICVKMRGREGVEGTDMRRERERECVCVSGGGKDRGRESG
jgi:hypothetical protein